MCLTAISGIQTAKEPITVYKQFSVGQWRVYGELVTEYFGEKYQLGKIKRVLYFRKVGGIFPKFRVSPGDSIGKGLHSFKNKPLHKLFGSGTELFKVVECEIPKGTKYIEGRTDIVSLKLIPKKVLS